jgi:hypothetical protein
MQIKKRQLELLQLYVCIPSLLAILLAPSVLPSSLTVLAQQMNFGASLAGNNLSPPVSTTANGKATFTLDQQGNIAYKIEVKNINGVIGAHISLKNGTDLAQVFNPYVEIAGKSGIPTGEVNGLLSQGTLTSRDLSGPLFGKNVTALTGLMNNGSVNVVVRTQAHESGEIQGVISPSSGANASQKVA